MLRWQLVLQQRIREALTKSKGHLADPVQVSFELGTLQFLLLDRIPAHAAIFESVELVRQSGNPYAVGLANAVLRKLTQAAKLQRRMPPLRILRGWWSGGLRRMAAKRLPRSAVTISFLPQRRFALSRRRQRRIYNWSRELS